MTNRYFDNGPHLTRRNFLENALALGALASLGPIASGIGRSTAADGKSGRRPNLLFVFDDQHSWDMLGCYGNEQVISPNVDRLASEGVRFNYCVSSAPVCTPYRGILMSGQHPLYNGALINDLCMLANNGKTIGEALRDAGYRTGYIGKWHIYGGGRDRPVPAGPYRYGFDEVFYTNNCTNDFRPGHCYYWNEKNEKVFFPEWEPYGQTRQALEFLDDSSDDRPFALFISWHPPHNHTEFRVGAGHYDAPDDLMALYDPAKIRLRPNAPDTPDRRKQYHGYMAQCTGVDRAFGSLMNKLREKGYADNTVTIFTSDHGDMLGSCGRSAAKDCPEDDACRVPLIIRAPGLDAGRVSDLLIGSLDLMPTILGLLGLPVPETCQGTNLAEAIRTKNDHATESVPLFLADWRGIFTHDYTYSFGDISRFFPQSGNCNRLYERRTDPYQQKNRFGDPTYKAVQEHLDGMTRSWMKQFGDPLIKTETVLKLCCVEEIPLAYSDKGTGALRGRPVDLIRKALMNHPPSAESIGNPPGSAV
jgi:arylsulfatase A-like enzyme